MNPSEQLAPFDVLRELENLCQQHAAGLPQQRAITKPWTGIGFRIGDINLVAAVDVDLLRLGVNVDHDLHGFVGERQQVRHGVIDVRDEFVDLPDRAFSFQNLVGVLTEGRPACH